MTYHDYEYYEMERQREMELLREEERASERRADDRARRALRDAEMFAKSCAVDRIEDTLGQSRSSVEPRRLRQLADEVDYDCGDWQTADEIRRIARRRGI